jgi:RNA polymerase sigma-70 factor (ECF subfamily)
MIETQEDTDKFTEIYNKYKNMMHNVAFKVLNNTQDAEDAVHEAFLKLARNIPKVESISCKKTETFLVILCRSASIDIYRKNKKERNKADIGEDNDMGSIKAAPALDTLGELISTEGYNRLIELIYELGDTYRDTIALRFILEWSNNEIADFLGINKNTVEVRINRGRAKLIEMLGKEEEYASIQRKRSK